MSAEAARVVVSGRSPEHLACGYGIWGGVALHYTWTVFSCILAPRGCATLTPGCILAPLQGARGRNDRNNGIAFYVSPHHTDAGEWGNWTRVAEGMSQHIIIGN